MQLVLDNGTAYETIGDDGVIAVGMIVEIPDGRAAEVIAVDSPDGLFFAFTTVTVRAWDETGPREFSPDQIAAYVEVGAPAPTPVRSVRLPKLHPGDMADCKCNTGEQHGKARAAAHARWSAAYDRIVEQQA